MKKEGKKEDSKNNKNMEQNGQEKNCSLPENT